MDKKYLVLTELFLPTKGGTAVWFAEVYRRLGGKAIHIVTAKVAGDEEVDAMHPNTIHRLELARKPWLKPESLLMYLRLFARAFRLAAGTRFDEIHAGRALPEGLAAWLVARLTGHRVLLYAHGEELTTWGQGAKYKTMRFALRSADRVIANSEFTRDLLRALGVRGERIALIYPGVDTDRFRPGLPCLDLKSRLGIEPGGRLVLSVGRLQRRKGFDTVMQCIARLRAAGQPVSYALIGIGDQREELGQLAGKLGIEDAVHFLGHVPQDDLPRWYNACDVFVMPNREIDGDTEGFGMVFIEAAACGKPAIAGSAGGTASAVLDGVTGFRVDGNDVGAVCARLQELLADEPKASALGRQGLERVRAEFAWEQVAARTATLLERHAHDAVSPN
jgi:phosphatidylinositol alpha-1,6-mannosyltransferase